MADVDTVTAGEPTTYTFRVTDDDGVVTDFELEQTKRMHLIVVRRDFAGFVHLHPDDERPMGHGRRTLTLDEPGVVPRLRRLHRRRRQAHPRHRPVRAGRLPAAYRSRRPSPTGDAGDGYTIELLGDVVAGEESELEFVVRHDGEVVTDLDDYLGAKGHLVALRDGDLAYLHVHPEEDRLLFEAEFPTAGTYRLFLQFDHGGTVRTGELTVHAEEAKS